MAVVSAMAVCAMVLVLTSRTAAAANVQTRDAEGLIDWTRGMITAEGAAAGDIRAPSPTIARIAAERRAIQTARARLARIARRLPKVAGATFSAAAKARLDRAVGRARVLDIQYGSDGSARVVVGLPIESVRVALVAAGPPPRAHVGAPSAIVVDARRIVTGPRIGLELAAGSERYAGPVVAHRTPAAASADRRLGPTPLRVRALRYDNGIVVLGPQAAAHVAAARKAGALVVLVLEAPHKGRAPR